MKRKLHPIQIEKILNGELGREMKELNSSSHCSLYQNIDRNGKIESSRSKDQKHFLGHPYFSST